MNERWIVAQTQPRRELWAAENIDRFGFEFYLPRISVTTITRGLKVLRAEPLFPRHIFVRSDQGEWHGLTGCWGVSGIIMFGESPGVLPLSELRRLRSAEDQGFIVLPGRQIGDKVRVKGGAFDGCTGVYQGDAPKDRVKVLLDLLGRKTTVLLADKHIEAV